ncbi:hypothetical protein ACFXMT_32305 [Streptomyces mirabilis]
MASVTLAAANICSACSNAAQNVCFRAGLPAAAPGGLALIPRSNR